jgi:recombination protein RecA
MLRATLLIAGKDLRQRVRDRSGVVIAFLAPFLLAAIIGLAFGSGDGFSFSATYAVADDDRGPLAARFVDGVLAAPGLAEVVTVRRAGAAEARDLVDRGEADAAFLIPAGFSASVQQGRSATITVLEAGASPVSGQVARALAEGYAAQLAATGLSVATALDATGRPPTEAEANRLAGQAATVQAPVRLVDGGIGAREITAASYFGPSMAIFFLFFTVSFGARSLLIERRQGTLRRLLASAAPPGAVIAGKALAAFVLGVTSMLVMWLATSLVFGADWGEPAAVVALIVSSVLAAIGVTALVVTLARTDEQADLGAVLGQLHHRYGPGIAGHPDGAPPVAVISTGSLALDAALRVGGVPRGRITEVYGPDSAGKTTLALSVIAQAQQAGGTACFIDAEHALDLTWAATVGVDSERLVLCRPEHGEQALQVAELLIRSGSLDVLAVDSIAALVPRVELDGEMGERHAGVQANLLSQALRKLAGPIARADTAVVVTNQLRQRAGAPGMPVYTSGGRALAYYASVRLDLRPLGQLKEDGQVVGSRIRVQVTKNKVAPAWEVAELEVHSDRGVLAKASREAASA